MREKKKGPTARKPTGPKHKDKTKRLLESKGKELEKQEAQLFLKFAESYPPADLKIDVALAVWNFLKFLKDNDYIILDAKRMVKVRLEVGEPR
ncbi:MAG: hypothetical protein HWN68_06415 [Desulfobacterales bacterium]|nr:hypothetical protein [Desulfobacterales bacterium]